MTKEEELELRQKVVMLTAKVKYLSQALETLTKAANVAGKGLEKGMDDVIKILKECPR